MTELCRAALVTLPLVDTPRQYTVDLTQDGQTPPTWKVDYKRLVYVQRFFVPTNAPQWGAFGDN